MVTREALLGAIKTKRGLDVLLVQLPKLPGLDPSPLLASDDPKAILIGLDGLSTACHGRGSTRTSIEVSSCLIDLALEYAGREVETNQALLCLASGSQTLWLTLTNAGEHAEALARIEAAMVWLAALGASVPPDVHLYRASSLVDLKRWDEAHQALSSLDVSALPAHEHGRLGSVRHAVDRHRAEATATEAPVRDAKAALLDEIGKLRALAGGIPGMDQLAELLGKGLSGEGDFSQQVGGLHEKLVDAVGDVGDARLRPQLDISQASTMFADPVRGRDPKAIAQAEAKLTAALDWSTRHQDLDLIQSARWALYLCCSRTARPAEAIEHLYALWDALEAGRRTIDDPIKRGGAFSEYPKLFEGLAWQAVNIERHEDVFVAIEGSNGRVVGDLAGFEHPRDAVDAVRSRLPRGEAAYLSFLVGPIDTFAVLVDHRGALHSQHIELTASQVAELASQRNPNAWRQPASLFEPASSGPTADEALAPLIAWLEPLVDSGALELGKHLVFSPDERLRLIPLQYVQFRGEPLVRSFSVSRALGAADVAGLLGQPAHRPSARATVAVPAVDDPPAMADAFDASLVTLSELLPAGDALEGEVATLDAVTSARLAERVVHFATHGVFPRRSNPYRASGLLLAHGRGLPSKPIDVDAPVDIPRLTPAAILERKLDLTQAHVTLQACVSGLSEEGVGSDALGLEWALRVAGAASILSTHWDVRLAASRAFCDTFYRRWLGEGTSRADAWRAAALESLDRGDSAESWAAFSLGGDWR